MRIDIRQWLHGCYVTARLLGDYDLRPALAPCAVTIPDKSAADLLDDGPCVVRCRARLTTTILNLCPLGHRNAVVSLRANLTALMAYARFLGARVVLGHEPWSTDVGYYVAILQPSVVVAMGDEFLSDEL